MNAMPGACLVSAGRRPIQRSTEPGDEGSSAAPVRALGGEPAEQELAEQRVVGGRGVGGRAQEAAGLGGLGGEAAVEAERSDRRQIELAREGGDERRCAQIGVEAVEDLVLEVVEQGLA